MKKTSVIISLLAAAAMTLFSQGRVTFDNLGTLNVITVGPFSFSPSAGSRGDFVGADYSIQLLWAPGTFFSQFAFDAASPSSSASFSFFGTTGSAPTHGPTVDGAGLFDGGTIPVGPPGTYTMQVRAWYNGGVYPTYAIALANIANPGRSQLFTVNVTASPTPPPNTIFPSFQVGILSPPPAEPSVLAVAGLGVACLLFFRCWK